MRLRASPTNREFNEKVRAKKKLIAALLFVQWLSLFLIKLIIINSFEKLKDEEAERTQPHVD